MTVTIFKRILKTGQHAAKGNHPALGLSHTRRLGAREQYRTVASVSKQPQLVANEAGPFQGAVEPSPFRCQGWVTPGMASTQRSPRGGGTCRDGRKSSRKQRKSGAVAGARDAPDRLASTWSRPACASSKVSEHLLPTVGARLLAPRKGARRVRQPAPEPALLRAPPRQPAPIPTPHGASVRSTAVRLGGGRLLTCRRTCCMRSQRARFRMCASTLGCRQ